MNSIMRRIRGLRLAMLLGGTSLVPASVGVAQTSSAPSGIWPLAISQAQSGCTSKHGPTQPCGHWVCLTGDNSWEDIPWPKGHACNVTGHCDGIDVYPDDCIIPVSGSIYPTYYISSVIYVPPGNGSNVDYGQGSLIGTTTSTTDSWQNSFQAQVTNGANIGLAAGSVTISFGNDWGGSTTQSTDVQTTVTGDMKVPAPASDSINHNYDQIVLLLSPEIDVTILGNQIEWSINLSRAIPQVVLVGWLNGTMTMPSNVANTLTQHGVTAQDYTQILGADPFANNPSGQGKPDPVRFAEQTILPYEPISGQYTWKTGNNYTSSATSTTNVSYSVGATVSTSVLEQSLKITDKFTWGNSSSTKNTVGSSSTETFQISMPSSTYNGPTDLYVYVDTVYKTFLFSFVNPSGTMTSKYSMKRPQP